jgi:hypothetical protein
MKEKYLARIKEDVERKSNGVAFSGVALPI